VEHPRKTRREGIFGKSACKAHDAGWRKLPESGKNRIQNGKEQVCGSVRPHFYYPGTGKNRAFAPHRAGSRKVIASDPEDGMDG